MDDGGKLAVRGQVRGREDTDGLAGCLGGADGALHIEEFLECDGLGILWGDCCSQDIVD